ncbi:MAG: hypothetical protein HY059_02350 [Proteobacteria bacterium]|nr:hypothetical protein [Pseudomonadota bacterium]
MAVSPANGASGLTASFLPVLQASLQRGDQLNSVSQQVADTTTQETNAAISSAASPSNDIAGAALTGRGMSLNITA